MDEFLVDYQKSYISLFQDHLSKVIIKKILKIILLSGDCFFSLFKNLGGISRSKVIII